MGWLLKLKDFCLEDLYMNLFKAEEPVRKVYLIITTVTVVS